MNNMDLGNKMKAAKRQKIMIMMLKTNFLLLLCLILFCPEIYCKLIGERRSFTIDYENDCFLKDGQPFKYYSGSFHYFRAPSDFWPIRLKSMKIGGLDAVETYIEWSTIEPRKGQFDFTGMNDIVRFIKSAQETGLLVILRPGPYICAERDLGGFPAWLQWEHPNITFRTNDSVYMKEVERYYSVLLPMLRPLLYENGGPVIMVQIENEYGSVESPSMDYKLFLRDLFRRHLGEKVLLFTTDGGWEGYAQKGRIPEVYPTIDFGTPDNVTMAVNNFRQLQPKGPIVNSEFYVGWLDNWSEPHMKVDTEAIIEKMKEMQPYNFSVNFYMYFGGSNYGFRTGANFGKTYEPDPTSYDYDAPISEGGRLTPKFFAIREFILREKLANNIPIADMSVEQIGSANVDDIEMPKVEMKRIGTIFDQNFQNFSSQTYSKNPLTFEDLKHADGFVLYTTELKDISKDFQLVIAQISDRALIYFNDKYVGKLSRTLETTNLTIKVDDNKTKKLHILVENQGRINFGELVGEKKGILSEVLIDGKTQTEWEHRTLYNDWNELANFATNAMPVDRNRKEISPGNLPTFFAGKFVIPKDIPVLFQTYLSFELSSWHKGVVFINGHNMGRYWPFTGPQKTLYVPSVFFKRYPEANHILMLELEDISCLAAGCYVDFVKNPDIDSKLIPD